MAGDEMLSSAFTYLFAKLLLILPVLTAQDCCYHNSNTDFSDLSVSSTFTSTSVDSDGSPAWELWVNVTWVPVPEYKGYDVAFELQTKTESYYSECIRSNSCEYENDNGKMRGSNWCAFFGLQYGFLYRIKMYVSVVADIRGNYVSDITRSPDCYDETESIQFCLTQPVEYIGKPFNITIDFERIDGTNDVTVYVTWQQPIHANPDTPLSFYIISWNSDDVGWNTIYLKNFTYMPTGFLMYTLPNPLQEDTNYTLSIAACVLIDNHNIRQSSATVVFSTYLPDKEQPSLNDNDLDDVYIYLIFGGLVVFLSVFLIAILHWKAKIAWI